MAREIIPPTGRDGNPFLWSSPFVDVFHRIGLDADKLSELESMMWFWASECDIDPEMIASAVMCALPPETARSRDERHSKARMGLYVEPYRRNARK